MFTLIKYNHITGEEDASKSFSTLMEAHDQMKREYMEAYDNFDVCHMENTCARVGYSFGKPSIEWQIE